MFCNKCGEKIDDDSKFCGYCGHKINFVPRHINTNNIYVGNSNQDEYVPDHGLWNMFYTFKGRLNPKRFFIRMLVLEIVGSIILAMIEIMSFIPVDLIQLLSLVVALTCMLSMLSLSVRRCHDIGRPGWYVITMLFPPLLMGLEVMKDRWGWHDMWGDYHERWRINGDRIWIGWIIGIIACIIMSIIFTFKPGQNGTNEYGPSPIGPMRDVPEQENKLLAFISGIENKVSSWYIIGAFSILFFIMSAWGTFIDDNEKNSVVNNPNNVSTVMEQEKTDQNMKAPKEPQPPVLSNVENNAKSEHGKNITDGSNNMYAKAKSDSEKNAMMALVSFHKALTDKNYHQAYDHFSDSLKGQISYDGWAPGFSTTIKSEVSDLTSAKINDNTIVVNYVLTATDKINNNIVTTSFNGTVEMTIDNGVWKINSITNKKR